MKRKNIIISIGLLLLLIIWMLSKYIFPTSTPQPAQTHTMDTMGQQQTADGATSPVYLETKVSIAQPYSKTINLPAQIDSNGYLSITSDLNSAKVENILVKNGQTVKKGQLLIELSSGFVPEQYEDAKQKYEIALSKYKTDKQLYAEKLISDDTFKQSKSAMTTAKVQMLSTKKTYNKHYITAPFAGVIDIIHTKRFASVRMGTNLLDLNDQNSYTISTSIPVNALKDVNINTPFIATDASGKPIRGYINGISSSSNSTTGTYKAKGVITSAGTFNIGEPIYIQIITKPEPAHEIALSQVSLNDNGELAIKVVEDGIIVLKPITILSETLKTAKVSGLGQRAVIFSIGAGFAEVGAPYTTPPKVSKK